MKTPMLPLCLAFSAGIAIADRFVSPAMAWESIVVTLFLVLSSIVFNIKADPTPFTLRLMPIKTLVLPLLTPFSCGIMLALVQLNGLRTDRPQDFSVYDVVIMSEPKESNKAITADAIITSGKYAGCNIRLAFDKSYFGKKDIAIGNGLEVRCRIQEPQDFKNSNFSYKRYLRVRNITFTAFIGKNNCKGKAVSISSLSFMQRMRLGALTLRHNIVDTYRELGISGESLAIAAAMTLGDKSMLTPSIQDTYSITGAAHVLALSGTHLVIVFFIFSLLFRQYSRRWYATGIILCLTWTYVVFVGMPASVVRAALMLSIFSFARLAERGKNSINSLATAASLMLAFNPQVLFDAGFQLSVAAVAGILLSYDFFSPLPRKLSIMQMRYPILTRLIPFITLVTIPMAAQIATAPLIAYYFGRLPVYFLITNIVVLPATSIILYVAVACIILFPIPILGTVAAWLMQNSIYLLNNILTFIASLPHSSVSIPGISVTSVAISYGILIIIIAYLQLQSGKMVNNSKINRIH